MEKVILQIWEESTLTEDSIIIGASIHLNEEICNLYIEGKYKNRTDKVIPNKYVRRVGKYTECIISITLYNDVLSKGGTLYIKDHQLHNLVMFNKLTEL